MRPERLWWISVRLHRRGLTPLARLVKAMIFQFFSASLPYEVDLAEPVTLWHRGLGTVIHPSTRIGKGVRIAHHVTVGGGDWRAVTPHFVTLEDGVTLTVGCSIIPKEGQGLTIGRGATIGAHAVITHDVPPGVTMVGPKATELPERIAPPAG